MKDYVVEHWNELVDIHTKLMCGAMAVVTALVLACVAVVLWDTFHKD